MKSPFFIGMIAVLVAGASTGCKTVVTTPATFSLPKPIYMAHYDKSHTSLVIPRGNLATEYAYGDWDRLALHKRGPWTKLKGGSIPTQGALGRRVVEWDPDNEESLRAALDTTGNCTQLSKFLVSDQRLAVFTNRLESAYVEQLPTAHYNEHIEAIFVEYDRSYAAWHNSNHELVDWLEQLGCAVSGWEWRAAFEVESAKIISKPSDTRVAKKSVKAPRKLVKKRPEKEPRQVARKKVKTSTAKKVSKPAEVASRSEDRTFWPVNDDPDAIVPR